VLDRVSKGFLTIAVAAVTAFLPLPSQGQDASQAQAQPAQPQWKDRAEYDLVQAITTEQNPSKKLELLKSWKEKYPTSAFVQMRNTLFIQTYNQMRQPDKVLAAGNEALQANPADFLAMYLMALNVQLLPKPAPDDLALGEKAANGILSNENAVFDPSKKPASTTDAAWTLAKSQAEVLAHVTLGWIALQKKDDATAEKEFTTVLQTAPNASTASGWPVDSAQVSSWLGTAVAHEAIQQKKPELYPQALFQFARAASLDQSQGGLPAASRQSYDTYFVNAFNRYHGQDAPEMAKLRDLAKANAVPPQGWTLPDINTVKANNEEKFKKENPALALWMTLKTALTAADGQQYFDANMKGTEVPGGAGGAQAFKGKLISSKPALHPKQLVLSLGDGTTPDATLILDAALPGKAEPGVEVEFAGVPTAFTKDPFNVTFDVEKKKVVGWPGKDAPAPRHHTAAKKKSE
jgi:tetratricopeptide (TPR) repeat protein